jgi:hypothetical protein
VIVGTLLITTVLSLWRSGGLTDRDEVNTP